MTSINQLWEERSRKYKNTLTGVLSKSFPIPINEYLDLWMYSQVKKIVNTGRHVKILDLGCGYGRLSEKLLKDCKNVDILGIDAAKTYVDIYNRDLGPRGKAIVGDIRKLPFRASSFDGVFMVTTLMYLVGKKDQDMAIGEIFRVLRPDGKFVIIERNPLGYQLITLGGLISKIRGIKHREIESVGFTEDDLIGLVQKNSGLVTGMQGIPLWTLLLPFSFTLSILSTRLGKFFLSFLGSIEEKLHLPLTFSLYIAYTGKSKK